MTGRVPDQNSWLSVSRRTVWKEVKICFQGGWGRGQETSLERFEKSHSYFTAVKRVQSRYVTYEVQRHGMQYFTYEICST